MTEFEKLEVNQFKRELDSCWYYCKKLQDINLDLYEIGVKLYEVGGIDYSKEFSGTFGGSGNSKLGLILKEESLIKDAQHWESKINYCRNILKLCSQETKDSLVRFHILEENYTSIADSYGYSRNGLKHNVDRNLCIILTSPRAVN